MASAEGFAISRLRIPGARQGRSTLPSAIVLITIERLPESDAAWSAYESAYRAMFAQHASIVLVFDTRRIGLPSLQLIMRKRALMAEMKPLTVGIVSKVIILTAHALVRDLVAALLKAGGQTAPFYIATDPAAAIDQVLDMAQILTGAPLPHTPGQLTRADVGDAAMCSLVCIWFLLIGKHYMRLAAERRG